MENEIKIARPFERCEFKLAISDPSENYARIVCEPLERGFGTTLGNALRRVLLSSLPGTSVYAVEVEGAVHEFTALPGVEEDLVQIILNLKDLILKSDTIADESYIASIDVDGTKVLTAGDIELPTGLEVINKDLVIAHISEGGHLHATLYIKNGRGYVTSEQNKTLNDLPLHGIATDSNFGAVTRVNYTVEPTRVGHDSHYDKLTLEVWTNGSVKPEDAVALSSRILMAYFENFTKLNAKVDDVNLLKDPEKVKEEAQENYSVEDLDLSVRSYNCLKRAGIANVLELTQKTEAEMMKVRNLGKKSLKEVKDKLEEKGLSFKESKGE
ncbi:MAG: DNA-directed RNA polymerase subunit alpha [Candidatus Onthovivens sp.]|nr:DNA-directed RNA polymerase subunit alpha [Mollicutes bacterium]MDY4857631.1 DNA-directed RNA polymerase subunit alpha [Candidatus Onthovivens sp.]MDY4936704.1 DNA-directed RNA polymerase subunit alpha [Candidatus Onthovivens sp.]